MLISEADASPVVLRPPFAITDIKNKANHGTMVTVAEHRGQPVMLKVLYNVHCEDVSLSHNCFHVADLFG